MLLFSMLTPIRGIMALAIIVAVAVTMTMLLTRGLPALFAKQPDFQRDSSELPNDDEQPRESQ
jgi:hypothetical protein